MIQVKNKPLSIVSAQWKEGGLQHQAEEHWDSTSAWLPICCIPMTSPRVLLAKIRLWLGALLREVQKGNFLTA